MAERDLRLSPRVEGTRDKRQSEVIKFEIEEIKQHFDENIDAIESQFAVADYLVTENKKTEAENIWRSQIVFFGQCIGFLFT